MNFCVVFEGGRKSPNKRRVRFLDLDEKEVQNVEAGGERRSKHSETWAVNAFNEWRQFKGYSLDKSIGDLSEEEDVSEFVEMLFKFTLQVTKSDGSLYPPTL